MAVERREYNGHSTYETWAVGMYLDGNYTGEATYRDVQAITEKVIGRYGNLSYTDEYLDARRELAGELEEYTRAQLVNSAPNKSLDNDVLKYALQEVNWDELADAQFAAFDVELPRSERAAREFAPNTSPSPTSLVERALGGEYGGAGVVAEAEQRVRHASPEAAPEDWQVGEELWADGGRVASAAEALKNYVEDEVHEVEGGGSLKDDLVGAALRSDVDWRALAQRRVPQPERPAKPGWAHDSTSGTRGTGPNGPAAGAGRE
jgi:hypothetical protein